MGEVEYNRLLDAVDIAMTVVPARDLPGADDEIMFVPVAANDNDGPWPHEPFPDGWIAS